MFIALIPQPNIPKNLITLGRKKILDLKTYSLKALDQLDLKVG